MSQVKQTQPISTKGRVKDFRLIPRIKEYLDTKKNRTKVNIYTIVDYLLNKYPEYGRKKRNVFVQYVEKAYTVLKQREMISSMDTDDPPSIRNDISSESEDELLVPYKDTNAVNNMMSNLYKNSPKQNVDGDSVDLDNQKRKTDPSQSAIKRIKVDDHSTFRKNLRLHTAQSEHNGQAQTFFIDRNGSNANVHGAKSVYIPILVDKTTSSSVKTDVEGRGGLKGQAIVCNTSDTGNMKEESRSINSPVGDNTLLSKHETTGHLLSKDKIKDTTKKKKIPKSTKKSKDENKLENSEEAKKAEKGPAVQKSLLTFKDVGGNEKNLEEICKLLVHMRHPEVYLKLGITPPRGFLLHGPPGCGKTLLANAIAGELDLPLIKLAAPELVSGVSGDSEEKIRDLFEKAIQCSPCVVFIDEIDAITPKRETASKDMERRMVAQLLSCLDDLNAKLDVQVLVIGATNRPDALDPALRRAGRFDREICLGIPDEPSRLRILQVLCDGLRLSPDLDLPFLARNSPGFVGADLMALTREAAMCAVNRVFQQLQCQVKYTVNTTVEGEPSVPIRGDLQTGIPVETCEKAIQEDTNIHETGTFTPKTVDSNTGTINATTNAIKSPVVECMDICTTDENPVTTITVIEIRNIVSPELASVEKHDLALKESVCEQAVSSHTISPTNRSDYKDGATTDSVDPAVDIQDTDRTASISGVQNTDHNNQTRDNQQHKLLSILCWLKEQPPLTEAQLSDLYITMEDFKEALHHVQPSAKREGFATVPDVTWDDIGALHTVREELQLAILAPIQHAEEFRSLGLDRAQGILLAGPPGCGKTLLAKAIANESGINFISVKGPELLNMYVGESEKAVRTVFQRARNSSPCVIFFDELDALCPRRSGTADSGSSSRVVNQLLTEMDGLEERKQVFIMAATNRPDIIDPAVLRPGRLDKTLYVGLPTQEDRLDILKCITKNGTKPCLGEDVNLMKLAGEPKCEGFTGADLAALVREASVLALKEAIKDKGRQPGDTIIVKGNHFDNSFSKIKASVAVKDQNRYKQMGEKMVVST